MQHSELQHLLLAPAKEQHFAIRKAFSRLSKEGKIKRIAHGNYLVPEIDFVLGELMPSMESVAEFIAKKRTHKNKACWFLCFT